MYRESVQNDHETDFCLNKGKKRVSQFKPKFFTIRFFFVMQPAKTVQVWVKANGNWTKKEWTRRIGARIELIPAFITVSCKEQEYKKPLQLSSCIASNI